MIECAQTHSLSPVVHVIGSLMIDRVVRVRRLPVAGETVAAVSSAMYAGGKGANQAVAAARCGGRVRMLGRTGVEGVFIVDALRAAGVDVRAICTSDAVAGAAMVMVAEGGENAIVIAAESNTRIAMGAVEDFVAAAAATEILLLQNECALLRETMELAAARGLRVWLNAAPADASLRALPLQLLAGLIVNEAEAQALTDECDPRAALEVLAARVARDAVVVVTLGAHGSIAAQGDARFEHAGFVVAAVDTVGCGDAFIGALLVAMASGMGLAAALARGNAAGALAATVHGAIPSLPECGAIDVLAASAERTVLESLA